MGLYLPHARISSHFGLSHAGRSTTAAVFTHPSLVSSALSRLGIELHRTILLLACARWHRPPHTACLCREVFRASTRSVLVSTHLNPLRHRILHRLATKGCSIISRLILLGFYLAGLAFVQLVAWDVSLYFVLGIIIHQSKLSFLQVFRPSWLAFIALLWLSCYPETFHKGSLGGLVTVYLVISAALAVFPLLHQCIKKAALFLGRNSLALFLFSPIFTMACKIFIPYLTFDSSRMLFLTLSLPLCILGALAVCRVLDALHLSPWLLGRKKALI